MTWKFWTWFQKQDEPTQRLVEALAYLEKQKDIPIFLYSRGCLQSAASGGELHTASCPVAQFLRLATDLQPSVSFTTALVWAEHTHSQTIFLSERVKQFIMEYDIQKKHTFLKKTS